MKANAKMTERASERLSDQLAVVLIDFRQWTGASVLREDDFRLGVGGELPPEQVIRDWGSKCICNPESLKIFAAIKRRAERFLSAHGVPFMGGIAIPLDKSPMVLDTLTAMAKDYNDARDAFLADYDRQMASWLQQNPAFAEQLTKSLLRQDDVRRRIYARFHVFKVSPIEDSAGGGLVGQTGFEATEASLGQTLLEDIAKEAQTLYLRSMAGKTHLMVRNLEHFRKWRGRLMGLRFLDNRIQALIDEIDRFLKGMPDSGRLEGEAFYRTCAMTLALADVERTKQLTLTLNDRAEVTETGKETELETVLPIQPSIPTPIPMPMSEPSMADPMLPFELVADTDSNLESQLEAQLEAEMDAFEAFEASLAQKLASEREEPNPETIEVEETADELHLCDESFSVPVMPSISQRARIGFW